MYRVLCLFYRLQGMARTLAMGTVLCVVTDYWCFMFQRPPRVHRLDLVVRDVDGVPGSLLKGSIIGSKYVALRRRVPG